MNAQILKFPRDRIKPAEECEAKILTFPVRPIDMSYLLPFAVAVMWMDFWKV
jgi:hypothetical protein